MPVIQFPESAVPNSAEPFLRDFGGVLTPFLGGPEQRINRLGTRFGLRVTLPPKRTRDEALVIQSRLLRARQDRLLIEWPQPDFDLGNPGAPVLASAVTSGSSLVLSGFAAGYEAKEGQFFSIIHAGRRYLHIFAETKAADASGGLSIDIFPMIRTPLSAGDVLEVAKPMIEGLVSPGDELAWQIAVSRLASFSFFVSEGA